MRSTPRRCPRKQKQGVSHSDATRSTVESAGTEFVKWGPMFRKIGPFVPGFPAGPRSNACDVGPLNRSIYRRMRVNRRSPAKKQQQTTCQRCSDTRRFRLGFLPLQTSWNTSCHSSENARIDRAAASAANRSVHPFSRGHFVFKRRCETAAVCPEFCFPFPPCAAPKQTTGGSPCPRLLRLQPVQIAVGERQRDPDRNDRRL